MIQVFQVGLQASRVLHLCCTMPCEAQILIVLLLELHNIPFLLQYHGTYGIVLLCTDQATKYKWQPHSLHAVD